MENSVTRNRVAIGQAIEAELGKRQGQRTDLKTEGQGELPGTELRVNLPEVPKGKTAEIASSKAGFGSEKTYRDAKTVVTQGTPALVDAMDKGTKAVPYLLKNQKRDEWIKIRQALRDAANQARSEAAKEQPRAIKPDGKSGFSGQLLCDSKPEVKPKTVGNISKPTLATATAAKVSPATAARTESLVNARPDLAQKVASQVMTLPEAMRQKKKDEVKQHLDAANAVFDAAGIIRFSSFIQIEGAKVLL